MQDKNSRQGDKTHEQHRRMLERKPDLDDSGSAGSPENTTEVWRTRDARGATHQESEHHKSNDPGQSGHKPQKHSRAEEKQQGE